MYIYLSLIVSSFRLWFPVHQKLQDFLGKMMGDNPIVQDGTIAQDSQQVG